MEGYRETGIQDRSQDLAPQRPTPSPDPPSETTTDEAVHWAHAFAEMIVDSVREGLLVLDLDLRVQAANKSFYDYFHTTPEATVGRRVYELGTGQWDLPELRQLLEDILPERKVMNDFEVHHDFPRIGHRVMCLNARQVDHQDLILLAIRDVTERHQALRELKQLTETLEERVERRTKQVRQLSAALTQAEAKERERIADLLHDNIQQLLFGATMMLTGMKSPLRQLTTSDADVDALQSALEESVNNVQAVIREAGQATKTLSMELSPPVAAGDDLPEALDWLANHMKERYNLTVTLTLHQGFTVAHDSMRVLLFRTARELLFNTIKHAETDQASIMGQVEDDQLILSVCDEGNGFDVAAIEEDLAGKGLPAVRQRIEALGGTVLIDTTPGEGTEVTITLPHDRPQTA